MKGDIYHYWGNSYWRTINSGGQDMSPATAAFQTSSGGFLVVPATNLSSPISLFLVVRHLSNKLEFADFGVRLQ